jgi:hypothetical protein
MRPRFGSHPRVIARAMERREAPGVCATHPFEAGLTNPPRAAPLSRARPSAKALRLPALHLQPPAFVGRSGAPRCGQLSLCPLKDAFRKSVPSLDRTRAG